MRHGLGVVDGVDRGLGRPPGSRNRCFGPARRPLWLRPIVASGTLGVSTELAPLPPDDLCPPTVRSQPRVELLLAPDRDPVTVYLARLGSDKSRRTMTSALRAIAAELGVADPRVIPWGSLRYPHVAALRARLAARLAPATVNQHLAALRSVAREAMRLELLSPSEYSLIRDVENVSGSRLPAGRHVERDELLALFESCSSSAAGARDRALLVVLRLGGLRRAELVALDLVDLDRASFALRVLGKGNKERTVYVDRGRLEIDRWLAHRGDDPGPLFCGVSQVGRLSGKRMAESSVAFILSRAAARADVAHLSPHDMRRTFVGDLLDRHADLVSVQRLAGHADVSTTARYDRRAERAAAATAALLDVPRK